MTCRILANVFLTSTILDLVLMLHSTFHCDILVLMLHSTFYCDILTYQ